MLRLLIHVPVYLLSLAVFALFILFTANRWSLFTVDSGLQIPPREAVLIDIGLIALFGLTHSLLARAPFKRTRYHKTIYLFVTSVVLLYFIGHWEPIPATVWFLPNAWYLEALRWFGWALLLCASAIGQHAQTFGFTLKPQPFSTPGIYRYIRHPQMLGLAIGLWATPDMTQGHLLLAAGFTLYLLVGTLLEERDMLQRYGAGYRNYRNRTWI